MTDADVRCDSLDRGEGLHQHMSVAAVRNYLERRNFDPSGYTFFTTTRHPLKMLWSYYNCFKPDAEYRYNWQEEHDPLELVSFEEWIENGRIEMVLSNKYSPAYLDSGDLSCLSLEAFACDYQGKFCIDRVFRSEDFSGLQQWLSEVLNAEVEIPHVNALRCEGMPQLTEQSIGKIRAMFPIESILYEI